MHRSSAALRRVRERERIEARADPDRGNHAEEHARQPAAGRQLFGERRTHDRIAEKAAKPQSRGGQPRHEPCDRQLQPDDPGIDPARPQTGPHQMRHDRKDQRREDDQHDRRRNRPRGSVPPPALEHGKQNPCRIGQQIADDESPQRKIQSIHNHES